MNGQAFGALMGGMANAYSAGKSIKSAMGKDQAPAMTQEAQKSSTAGASIQGYSGDLSNFTPGASGAAEAAAPKPAAESTGFMGKLGNWLAEMPADFGMSKGAGNGQ